MGVDMVVMTGPQMNYFCACKFLHIYACVCVVYGIYIIHALKRCVYEHAVGVTLSNFEKI